MLETEVSHCCLTAKILFHAARVQANRFHRFTAELENGDISIIDPLTRQQMAFFQPQDKKKAKVIGTGRTGRTDRTVDDKGWIVHVTASGELQQVWLRKENSVWKTDDFTRIDIGSTGINPEHEVKIFF